MADRSPTSAFKPCVASRDAASTLSVVVLGYIIRGPIGGMAWHHLNYVLALRQLGHDVLFLEDSDDYPSCYNPSTGEVTCDPTYGLNFAKTSFDRLGLGECWAYYDAHQKQWHGPASVNAIERCATADLLLNVSGVNPIRPWLEAVPIRAFIDTDPSFTQIRHLTNGVARQRAQMHNRFFTFAESIHQPDCLIPDDGFSWMPTRQPIAIDAWPQAGDRSRGAFTTVMQWDSYPPLEFDGKRYGMKSDSFELIRQLPKLVGEKLEIALGGVNAPRESLRDIGWSVVDPLAVTHDPWTYQEYVRQSCGELSIAKHGYVASRSGWFSERTACYLAAGRPAVVQDTGFSKHIPCGNGLIAFRDLQSAKAGITNVTMNYARHCREARDLAETYFGSNKVLADLLDSAFSGDSAKSVSSDHGT
jgi:hypothetical protein